MSEGGFEGLLFHSGDAILAGHHVLFLHWFHWSCVSQIHERSFGYGFVCVSEGWGGGERRGIVAWCGGV